MSLKHFDTDTNWERLAFVIETLLLLSVLVAGFSLGLELSRT